MKSKVLVTEFVEIPEWAKTALEIIYEPDIWKNLDQLKNRISECDGMIVRNRTVVDAALIAQGKQLKVIGRLGAGLDNVDIQDARDREIPVVFTPDANTDAVAEYCVGQIIAAARKLFYANTSTHAGKWDRLGCMGRELKEITVGIIGYGNIGKRLNEMLKAFSSPVIVASRHMNVSGAKNINLVSREELFSAADIISVHIEGGETTRNSISEELLSLMQTNVIFMNTSRGDVVDEDALAIAIKARPEGTFILDVRGKEPPEDDKFRNLPNVILSPHTGAFTAHAQKNVAETVFADVASVLRGETPKFPVTRY